MLVFGKWSLKFLFAVTVKRGPILPDSVAKEDPESLYGNIEVWKGAEMPSWVKSAAKLFNSGSEGQDWTALAKKLGQFLRRFGVVYCCQ